MIRVIARLDVKGEWLVKGVQFEGWRKLGRAADFARRYAEDADELLILSAVASNFGSSVLPLIEEITANCFVPVTVGGGIRSVEDMRAALLAGADKMAINSAAIADPTLITRAAQRFGSQAIVVSIEAKRRTDGTYEAYTDCGRNPSGKEVQAWTKEAEERGAGEILVTSIDRDGTRNGYDLDLLHRAARTDGDISMLISGGIATAKAAAEVGWFVDGVSVGAGLHFGSTSIPELKRALVESGLPVRPARAA